jgi:predicted aldo/keto reductase-like oxidoreductase
MTPCSCKNARHQIIQKQEERSVPPGKYTADPQVLVLRRYGGSMAGTSRLASLIGSPQRVGLGGEGVLRTQGRENEALAMLAAAYGSGIRYFDSAPAYAGSERYYGRFFAEHPERKEDTFQASKSAERDAKGASSDLARTLERMGRNRLGLWQIHDVRDHSDIRLIEGRGGALSAFLEARQTGTVRMIGVTGHHDPAVLQHAVENWDVDAVLLPVNPVEAAIGGFADRVIPAARERGIGVIGMKVLGAGHFLFKDAGLSPEVLVRFALSQDVDLVVVGCSSPHEAELLARLGREYVPMDEETQARLVNTVRPYAEGLAFYRGAT